MKTSSEKITRRAALGLASCLAFGVMATPTLADIGAKEVAPAPVKKDRWVVMAGTSLKSTLEGWSRVAGWTLIWDSPVDYRLRASATFAGSFEQGASQLIDSIYEGNPELIATFHRGNRVLHIENQPLSSN